MVTGTTGSNSASVSTSYVQDRLARLGALMAAVIGFISIVQLLINSAPIGELLTVSYWVAVFSGVCWAALWLACTYVPMGPRSVRAVEALGIGGAVTALAVVGRLGPIEGFTGYAGPALGNDMALGFKLFKSQQLSSMSVVLAMALALVARAALVPTSPRRTAVLTASVGLPFVLVPLWHIPLFAVPSDPGTPEFYASFGDGRPDMVVALLAGIWWSVTTWVCYVISRVVHGLHVEMLTARMLGQYTLGEKLGEGGMGEVYIASHSRLRRSTAIKLLPASRSSEHAVARFESEVQLTAQLTHPNTITIYDYGRTDDGTFYYAMEHLAGATLEDVVKVGGPLTSARVLSILEQATGALEEAHEAGLIHRDIKPANIMLTRQGMDPDTVKVLDFGLVRKIDRSDDSGVTQEGKLIGTPLYMAPEAVSSSALAGPQSDIYALGAVGYYLLTGTHVFSGQSLVETCAHHLHTKPEPVASRLGQPVAEDLEAVIMQCLAKAPGERPQGASGLLVALRACEAMHAWTVSDSTAWWQQHRTALDAQQATHRPAQVSDQTMTVAGVD